MRTVYEAAVSVKLAYLEHLHYYDVALSPQNLQVIEFAVKELESFQDFLEKLDSSSRKRMDASLERAREEILEYQRADAETFDEYAKMTHSLIETLKKTKEEYYENSLLEDQKGGGVAVVSSSSKMVGLRDERRQLKEALINTELITSFFLLHGMAGSGKTTLAHEIFHDLDISEWFECRAWVRVGHGQKTQDFIEAILAQLNPRAHRGESFYQLQQTLEGKRCLIVLDDVWDNHLFEDYWGELADLCDRNKSRFVIITRTNHLEICRKPKSWYVFEKRLLNKQESWDLLREKVFFGGSCPPQLEDAGKKIAEKCDGLPLTVVTVADLLSKVEESLWIDVATRRKHQLFTAAYDQISEVLRPSFMVLDGDLKFLFLYVGVFPLKHEIRQSKLLNLWAAEEIVDPFILMEKGYYSFRALKSLDFSNLVMIYQRSSTYYMEPFTQAIRACRLHSSWWHFCQREAKRINFFHVVDCPDDGLEQGIKGQSRLSIHSNVLFAHKDVHNSMEENCSSTAQSLLCFGQYLQYQVPICFGLKLLRRLDALNIRFYDFPLEVVQLVMLRYLALTCNGNLPPSISKLQKLQYLIVHPHLRIKSCGVPNYMPMEIWDLEELKHLEVIGSDLPDSGDKFLGMLSTLLDVSTCSCPVLDRLPNLKKLKIRIELTPEAEDPLSFSRHITNLINLYRFKCIVVNPGCKFQAVPPAVASFPVLPYSLLKLSLSGLGYPWEKMRMVALLPRLKQLKLRCNAFQGNYWEVENGGFPSLYFLLIEDIDLVKLVGGSKCFKRLKHLSIKHCYKLEKVELTNFHGVWKIDVVDSNPLAEKSIKEIMLKTNAGDRSESSDILALYSWKSTRAPWVKRGLPGSTRSNNSNF